jgi:hypothetical protein
MARPRLHARLMLGLLAAGALVFAAAAVAVGAVRPMTGKCATSFAIQQSGAIAIEGTCNLTHVGRSSYEAVQTVAINPDGSIAITVVGFYTAANGDTLRSSIAGTGHFLPDGGVSYTTTETFTGGTGRFADATGEVTDDGLAAFTSPTGGTSTYTMRGSIAY